MSENRTSEQQKIIDSLIANSESAASERGAGTPPNEPVMLYGKILVVDDEPDFVITLSARLKSVGHEVVSACDGTSATSMALVEKPDLILLDIGMPNGDGHTVCERLKEMESTAHIPIVFVSARASAPERERARDNCAFDYLTKPFNSIELLEVVQRALAS